MFVCVTSDLGAEVAFAVITRLLISHSYGRAIVIPMSKIREKGLLELTIKEITGDLALERIRGVPVFIEQLCLFGDFWNEEELDFAKKSSIKVSQYFFDGSFVNPLGNRGQMNPTKFLFHQIEMYHHFQGMSGVGRDAVTGLSINDIQKCQQSLDLLDLRCCGKEPLLTQPLISGLMNHPELSGSLEARFHDFFERHSKKFEKDVLMTGQLIVTSQLEVVKERIKNNSWVTTFSSGFTCAVTSGSEFINMMHEQLHEHYKDIPVTCVLTIWLNNGSPTLAHSFRSWDGVTDVKALVLPSGGGGSPTAAGTRLPIDLHLNY
jgi:hypothetical protein